MFVDKPVGVQNPLDRKQLKWLLGILTAVVVGAVVWYAVLQGRSSTLAPVVSEPKNAAGMSVKPTPEDIQKQLEILAKEDTENPVPKPTEADIQKQLEVLAKEDSKNPTPKPSQEEIQKQLEMLSK